MTKKVLTPYAARLESKSTGAWEAINYDDCDQMAAGHDARLQVFSLETLDRRSSSQIPSWKFHPLVPGFRYIKDIIVNIILTELIQER